MSNRGSANNSAQTGGVETFVSRGLVLVASVVAAVSAGLVFYSYGTADGPDHVDVIRALLMTISTWWLAWGAAQGLLGLTSRPKPPALRQNGPIRGRTAILVPVYNEDPQITFARIAAMDASLAATGEAGVFHFAVLSDTRNDTIAQQERQWFAHLVKARNGTDRMFYRRRIANTGKKAGNIEEFITSTGATLVANGLKILDDGVILRSEANLAARRDAGLSAAQNRTAQHLLKRLNVIGESPFN